MGDLKSIFFSKLEFNLEVINFGFKNCPTIGFSSDFAIILKTVVITYNFMIIISKVPLNSLNEKKNELLLLYVWT